MRIFQEEEIGEMLDACQAALDAGEQVRGRWRQRRGPGRSADIDGALDELTAAMREIRGPRHSLAWPGSDVPRADEVRAATAALIAERRRLWRFRYPRSMAREFVALREQTRTAA